MSEDIELSPCGCGNMPNKLCLSDAGQGGKWAYVMGDCCNEWTLEFRTGYNALDSDKCMELAVEAWNDATRTNEIKSDSENEIAELKESESNLKSQWMYYQDLLSINGFDGITDVIVKHKALQAQVNLLRDFIESVPCGYCNGSGAVQISEHEVEQCRYCWEKDQALSATEPQLLREHDEN